MPLHGSYRGALFGADWGSSPPPVEQCHKTRRGIPKSLPTIVKLLGLCLHSEAQFGMQTKRLFVPCCFLFFFFWEGSWVSSKTMVYNFHANVATPWPIRSGWANYKHNQNILFPCTPQVGNVTPKRVVLFVPMFGVHWYVRTQISTDRGDSGQKHRQMSIDPLALVWTHCLGPCSLLPKRLILFRHSSFQMSPSNFYFPVTLASGSGNLACALSRRKR